MSKENISNFEDDIANAKFEFRKHLRSTLELSNTSPTPKQIRDKLTDLHFKAVDFFNIFGRSTTEYRLNKFSATDEIILSKIDDAINVSNTIIKYWKLLIYLSEKHKIKIPKPAERSYSNIQRFIKEFEPEKAFELKAKFEEIGLPTKGFKNNNKLTVRDMKIDRAKQIKYSFGAGILLIVALLIITILIECPTESQNFTFRVVLALAAASFSAIIPGLIDIKYREIITASGALAVFVIVFMLKPAQLTDFKSCQEEISGIKDISGIVYFGKSPASSIKMRFLKQNKITNTNDLGNFRIRIDTSTIDENLDIQLLSKELHIDTIINFKKSSIEKSLDIFIPMYCLQCIQRDSTNIIVNRKQTCGGSQNYIKKYIQGFTDAGNERNLDVKCTTEKPIIHSN